jgi:late competence protein required for DNA uptake (superfamily II DNA/RNA helicase)
MAKFELIDPKMREGLICARCGKSQSVKYWIAGSTYCNKCFALRMYISDDIPYSEAENETVDR